MRHGVASPPSLVNIFKELEADLGIRRPAHGCLEHWARQGVLLLNAVLTVRAHQANSHQGKGWEQFTDEVIRRVDAKPETVVFVLWGSYARKKKALITGTQHVVIESADPSPLSADNGFFGSRPFSRTYVALVAVGREPIDWQLPDPRLIRPAGSRARRTRRPARPPGHRWAPGGAAPLVRAPTAVRSPSTRPCTSTIRL